MDHGDLINTVKTYKEWYEGESKWYEFLSSSALYAVIFLGLLATILAATLISTGSIEYRRWVLVSITASDTALAGLQRIWAQIAALRERGRIEFTLLQQYTEVNLSNKKFSDSEFIKFANARLENAAELERQYGKGPKK